MAILTHTFDGDGATEDFTVSSTILSKSHVRVDLFYGSTGSKLDADAIDHQVASSDWDVLTATILFKTAPANGYEVRITVSDDGNGLELAPSQYTTVITNLDDILALSAIINDVSSLASITSDITSLSSISAAISDVASEPLRTSIINAETYANQVEEVKDAVIAIGSDIVNGIKQDYHYVAGTPSGDYDGVSLVTFPASYNVTFVDVYVEGVKLVDGIDFTATDGTTITLVSPATAGNDIQITGWGVYIGNTQVVEWS